MTTYELILSMRINTLYIIISQVKYPKKEEEITSYIYLHTESIMLMLGLMALSWLKVDLKENSGKSETTDYMRD